MSLEALELRISKFLRWGALSAGAILFVGWCVRLGRGGSGDLASQFGQRHVLPLGASLVAARAAGDWGLLIEYLGLGVLISLPIIRVALVALLFTIGGERRLALAATFVLMALALSFALGFAA